MIADFHIHSDFSDGDSPPEEIVKLAIRLGMNAVAVVDHVNRESDWVGRFGLEIDRLREAYADQILVLSGLEAKCRTLEGDMDIPSGAAESVDFVVGAVHRIPAAGGFMKSQELASHVETALENWRRSVLSMLANPAVDVWAHPGRLLLVNTIGIPFGTWDELSRAAALNGKFAELTVSAPDHLRMPSDLFAANGVKVVPASDSHRLEDVRAHASRCACDDDAFEAFVRRVGRSTE